MIAFVDSLPTLNASVSFAIGLCAVYVALVYKRWSENFAGRRVKRSVQGSPSHDNLPALRGAKAALDGTNSSEKTPMRRSSSLSSLSDFGEELGGGIAKTLDMDHVYLSFGNYLWAATFISPFTYLLAARRLFCLRMNTILINRGFISLPSCSYESLAAEICLEQTQVIHFSHMKGSKSEGTRIAVFLFKNLPYVDDQCKFRVAEELKVEVDLINRSLSMATLDNEILSAEDATILLYFTLIAAIHPQMHSAANWSVNVHESLAKTNPGLLTNSVATVMYNHMGYSGFDGSLAMFARLGLCSPGWSGNKMDRPLLRVFNHAINANAPVHHNIRDLVSHSRLVGFVVKVRAIFFAEFVRHKADFPGIDCEALFIGTVLHSLDHYCAEKNVTDPLYMNTSNKRFGKMAEINRIVSAAFVTDVDGIYFGKRFYQCSHPFYLRVYAKAAKIDKELADNMDCCIIR